MYKISWNIIQKIWNDECMEEEAFLMSGILNQYIKIKKKRKCVEKCHHSDANL